MTITHTLISSASLFLLSLLAASAVPTAQAQQSQTPVYSPPGILIANTTGGIPADASPIARSMSARMAFERNQERQQKMVSDSARLLALAQKLNAEVAKSDMDTLSVSVVKEANEVEKLAKSIKDKMRHGY